MSRALGRRCVGAALVLAGLALAYLAARMVLAGFAYQQAGVLLADWEKKGVPPHPRAAQLATQSARRAVDLAVSPNGRYVERLGVVLQWQHFQAPFGAAHVAPIRREARAAFRQATVLRPQWPDAWLSLAYSKLYLLELDAEFAAALARAAALGPWRAHVNAGVAEVGLLAWPSLDADGRELTLRAARRALEQSAWARKKVRTAAHHARKLEMLCGDAAMRPYLDCGR
ncbi:hypothetical protein CKCBHOJB_01667 [Thauera sp. GDN1]|uniref:hypothetical protein n=1 Tax=Thauera sp. GDN1 TaxID=2944810 RepID=UPI0024785BD7|nr:hypothetical protein [Thauera sp. GDN1]WEN42082.1 hypothetical protein CKCBHOJB_01667 [Thauera sp. GDN1]